MFNTRRILLLKQSPRCFSTIKNVTEEEWKKLEEKINNIYTNIKEINDKFISYNNNQHRIFNSLVKTDAFLWGSFWCGFLLYMTLYFFLSGVISDAKTEITDQIHEQRIEDRNSESEIKALITKKSLKLWKEISESERETKAAIYGKTSDSSK